MWAGLLVTELRHSDDLRIWEQWELTGPVRKCLHSTYLVIVADRETENVPGFEARLLVTAFVKEWMVVDVVDVDQFPRIDNVADYASGEGKSHLILLKIQNCT